jgi:hypothetical protein
MEGMRAYKRGMERSGVGRMGRDDAAAYRAQRERGDRARAYRRGVEGRGRGRRV